MKQYELFTTNFSIIIQAESMQESIKKYYAIYDYTVIMAIETNTVLWRNFTNSGIYSSFLIT